MVESCAGLRIRTTLQKEGKSRNAAPEAKVALSLPGRRSAPAAIGCATEIVV